MIQLSCKECIRKDSELCIKCKDNVIYEHLESHRCYYEPCCRVMDDCINDPAYLLWSDPEFYKKVYGNMTPKEVFANMKSCQTSQSDDCDDCDEYDDEDK